MFEVARSSGVAGKSLPQIFPGQTQVRVVIRVCGSFQAASSSSVILCLAPRSSPQPSSATNEAENLNLSAIRPAQVDLGIAAWQSGDRRRYRARDRRAASVVVVPRGVPQAVWVQC